MDIRSTYKITLTVNGRIIKKAIIDQHYALKHKNINDELILQLLQTLHNEFFDIEIKKGIFEYFVVEPVIFQNKSYRLVLVLSDDDDYLGVVNAFRVRKKKL